MELVLASASPQRRDILAQLGVPYEVRPAAIEELENGDPAQVAEENARRKALDVSRQLGPGRRRVLGVDTIVTIDGLVLGKPADAPEARAMVGRLQGRTHEVLGGIALASGGELMWSAVARTAVTFRPLTVLSVAAYVATGEWEGRAGGYAIQLKGAALVQDIVGDYLNVVGLPVGVLVARAPELIPWLD